MNKILIPILLLALFAACIFGAVFGFSHSSYPKLDEPYTIVYAGKQVFDTEGEYSVFKRILGRQDVQIYSITVLASEPPIVVTFKAEVPNDVDFAYGSIQDRYYVYGTRWGMFASGVISFLVILMSSLVGYFMKGEDNAG